MFLVRLDRLRPGLGLLEQGLGLGDLAIEVRRMENDLGIRGEAGQGYACQGAGLTATTGELTTGVNGHGQPPS